MQKKNYSYVLVWMMAALFLGFISFTHVFANNAAPSAGVKSDQPPSSLVDILRQNLSAQTSVGVAKLQLVEAVKETWPDGCLGLAKPDELCSQALVDGWKVTFSDGSRRWSYHTDMSGQNYRLEQK